MKFERFERRQALDILTADIIRHASAIERFERRRRSSRAAADIALYIVAVLAVIVVCWIA